MVPGITSERQRDTEMMRGEGERERGSCCHRDRKLLLCYELRKETVNKGDKYTQALLLDIEVYYNFFLLVI